MSPGDVYATSGVPNSSRHYCLILSSATDDRSLCMIVTSRHAVLANVSSCDVKRFYNSVLIDADVCVRNK